MARLRFYGYIRISHFVAILLSAALIIDMAGCAQLQRKFTRKKKEAGPKIPHYHPVKEYKRDPIPQMYQRHYVFWQTWHSELLSVMGSNRKKDMRCINEIIENLKVMRNLLVPKVAAELDKHIKNLEGVRDKILQYNPSTYNTTYMKVILEGESRSIRKGFLYRRVKNSLIQEEEQPQQA